jgi:hypothetical protein
MFIQYGQTYIQEVVNLSFETIIISSSIKFKNFGTEFMQSAFPLQRFLACKSYVIECVLYLCIFKFIIQTETKLLDIQVRQKNRVFSLKRNPNYSNIFKL